MGADDDPDAVVELNVGGTLFSTTRRTLSASRQLAALPAPPLPRGRSGGPSFVDHNPRYFSVVLDYLRLGTVAVPPGTSWGGVAATFRALGVELPSELRCARAAQQRDEDAAAAAQSAGIGGTLLAVVLLSLLAAALWPASLRLDSTQLWHAPRRPQPTPEPDAVENPLPPWPLRPAAASSAPAWVLQQAPGGGMLRVLPGGQHAVLVDHDDGRWHYVSGSMPLAGGPPGAVWRWSLIVEVASVRAAGSTGRGAELRFGVARLGAGNELHDDLEDVWGWSTGAQGLHWQQGSSAAAPARAEPLALQKDKTQTKPRRRDSRRGVESFSATLSYAPAAGTLRLTGEAGPYELANVPSGLFPVVVMHSCSVALRAGTSVYVAALD
eukprot:TRINITY_DN55651_c0_g1_i1.p1 TRINITY_DN55651_c0_g1~~TRINITY_DN55651_c0_g1_i1.p1  ORF type:complete len:414 (+),score=67.43 TRINITY_DN55651_c0_g1_i1:97-1242(+)